MRAIAAPKIKSLCVALAIQVHFAMTFWELRSLETPAILHRSSRLDRKLMVDWADMVGVESRQ
jgi:hypothetical protein